MKEKMEIAGWSIFFVVAAIVTIVAAVIYLFGRDMLVSVHRMFTDDID